jgi:hypothetical protein
MELKNKGTYVGLRVLPPSNTWIYKWVRDYLPNVPNKKVVFDRRLHTTVIYSRKHAPELKVDPSVIHQASFVGYEIFGENENERILVAKLNAPTVVARHLQLMAEYGFTYDFPVFVPHISLCYDFTGTTEDIPPINFPIQLGQEYTEDLDLDWK